MMICDLRLKSGNELLRMNRWAKDAYNKKIRERVALAATFSGLQSVVPTTDRRNVTITVYHKGVYDRDGLYSAIKPVLDAIVARKMRLKVGRTRITVPDAQGQDVRRWGLILDDSEKYVNLTARQEKMEGYAVKIEIE